MLSHQVCTLITASDVGQREDKFVGALGRTKSSVWAVHGSSTFLQRHRAGRYLDGKTRGVNYKYISELNTLGFQLVFVHAIEVCEIIYCWCLINSQTSINWFWIKKGFQLFFTEIEDSQQKQLSRVSARCITYKYLQVEIWICSRCKVFFLFSYLLQALDFS